MQTQDAKALQAELEVYNQKHGTSYSFPGDTTALYYEFEGRSIERNSLTGFPELLKIWDGANVANQWLAENGVEPAAAKDDNLPF